MTRRGKTKGQTMTVRELLCDESRWTQITVARDRHGKPTHSSSELATQWCLLGALHKCYGGSPPNEYNRSTHKLFETIEKVSGRMTSIAEFNDKAAWSDIDRVLDLAGV